MTRSQFDVMRISKIQENEQIEEAEIVTEQYQNDDEEDEIQHHIPMKKRMKWTYHQKIKKR